MAESKGKGEDRGEKADTTAGQHVKGPKDSLLVRVQKSNALAYMFIISFILFLLTRNVLFAVLTGVSLISYFAIDVLTGAKQHGVLEEMKELIIAAVIALVIWFGLMSILNTSSPISAIISCSMLPHFERGDMIILQGASPADIKAPEVELSKAQFDGIYGKANKNCNTTGVIDYMCSNCTRLSATDKKLISTSKCAREIRVANQVIDENFSNDVIVYIPTYVNGVPYGGDIIHRVFVKLKVDGKYYFLTKGDNNDAFDASAFNIVREEDVKGRVVARIPWLGYLKLFISGSFVDPKGCEVVYAHAIQ